MLQPEKKVTTPNSISPFPELPKAETPEEDSLQFLWAVSYCDLLMVLMSFFILFFQINDNKEQASPVRDVMLALKNETQEVVSKAPAALANRMPSSAIEKLANVLQSENVQIIEDPSGKIITLDFRSNLYPPRGYAFPKSQQAQLEKILKEIKPFSKNLMITFIGHADESKITMIKDNIIDSNLVLSNLRATRAVEIAFQLGFDPMNVTGQGAGEFSRNTRSLSIRISERSMQ